MLLVLTPQFLINSQVHHAPGFLVQNKIAEDGITNLYLAQLEWGIRYQKYETNAGNAYPAGQVLFLDPSGELLLNHYNIPFNRSLGQNFSSYNQ